MFSRQLVHLKLAYSRKNMSSTGWQGQTTKYQTVVCTIIYVDIGINNHYFVRVSYVLYISSSTFSSASLQSFFMTPSTMIVGGIYRIHNSKSLQTSLRSTCRSDSLAQED